MLVSAVQMDVKTRSVERNIDRAYSHIQEAERRGSRLILLPEMWNVGFAYPDLKEWANRTHRPTLEFMGRSAKESKAWLVGSIPEPADGGVYNTLYWVSPDGGVVAKYRKAHLFTLTSENDHFLAGNALGEVVTTDVGPAAGLICFDIRFPEMARRLALAGARLLCVAAQFPHPRDAHWETLLRARAIENQMWVVAANRVGESGRLAYFGKSMVIDPWGELVEAEMSERECVVTADVDLDVVGDVRSKLPCARRADLYGNCKAEAH